MAPNLNLIEAALKQSDRKLDNILQDLDMELTSQARKYKISEKECCSFESMYQLEENLNLVKTEFQLLKERRDTFAKEHEGRTAELEARVKAFTKNMDKKGPMNK